MLLIIITYSLPYNYWCWFLCYCCLHKRVIDRGVVSSAADRPSSSSLPSFSSSSSSSPSSRKRRLTSEEQLISDLFRSYDTDARAVVNSSSTVNVQINYMMLRIQRLVFHIIDRQPNTLTNPFVVVIMRSTLLESFRVYLEYAFWHNIYLKALQSSLLWFMIYKAGH